jgi:multisubunit Na+/H+ antiporter MnhB subunit
MNTKLLSSISLAAAFAVSAAGFIAGLGLPAFIIGASAMLVTILAHDYQRPQYCGRTVCVSCHALPLAA